MKNEKTSVFANGLIWFGAGVSIAEIFTGTLIAPLGFAKGLLSIVLGHIIGCVLLFLAGFIGAKNEKSAMETVKMSFGKKGALLFAVLNVLQLVGWTAIMIIQGARAVGIIAGGAESVLGNWLWCVVIGLLIIVWILIGVKNLGKLNTVVMSVLFICTVILSAVVFSGGADFSGEGGLSFGAAVELSVAMPLSWLPVISDYTKEAKKPFGATLASTVTYFAASCWMYVIGMAAALFTGESEIAKIMLTAGLGIIGIITLIASTVTTTFLDAYSAGVSAFSIWGKLNIKWTAVAIAAVGTVLAIFTPIEQFENFLYLIGSVFAPMIAVQIADTFILKKNYEKIGFNVQNLVIWLAGFIIYRIFMKFDTPVGYTLPAMLIVVVICVLADKIRKMAGK